MSGDAEQISAAKVWLRQRREDLGLSQAALAEMVGISPRSVLNAESPSNSSLPQGPNLWRMLQALDGLVDGPPADGGPLQELRDEVFEGLAALARGIERIEARLDDSDDHQAESR